MSDLPAYLFSPSGIVLFPLAICSVIAVALILDKLLTVLRLRLPMPSVAAQLRTLIESGQVSEALQVLDSAQPFFVDAVNAVESHLEQDKGLRDEAATLALQATGRRLYRRLAGLITIAGLAPLLGLLGTVIGLMVAFRALEGIAGPVEPGVVASGLWQAMITTVVGLSIAVPCLVAHNWLRSRIRNHMDDAAALLSRISLAASTHQAEG